MHRQRRYLEQKQVYLDDCNERMGGQHSIPHPRWVSLIKSWRQSLITPKPDFVLGITRVNRFESTYS